MSKPSAIASHSVQRQAELAAVSSIVSHFLFAPAVPIGLRPQLQSARLLITITVGSFFLFFLLQVLCS
jgi:hypothetical protein